MEKFSPRNLADDLQRTILERLADIRAMVYIGQDVDAHTNLLEVEKMIRVWSGRKVVE